MMWFPSNRCAATPSAGFELTETGVGRQHMRKAPGEVPTTARRSLHSGETGPAPRTSSERDGVAEQSSSSAIGLSCRFPLLPLGSAREWLRQSGYWVPSQLPLLVSMRARRSTTMTGRSTGVVANWPTNCSARSCVGLLVPGVTDVPSPSPLPQARSRSH
jgi:hypothetical protein